MPRTSAVESFPPPRRPLFGGWVSVGSTAAIEAFVEAGYDYVGIDCQHSSIAVTDAVRIGHALVGSATSLLVRVPSGDPHQLAHALDGGAAGVIVPLVETAEQAASAVAACRYPPAGVRSYGPFHPRLPRQIADLEKVAGCWAMIETRLAVTAVDAICATAGLTGLYVGPADLAISYGHPPHSLFTPNPPDELRQALADIVAACTRHRVIAGIHAGSGRLAAEFAMLGFEVLTLASDAQLLARGAARHLGEARSGALDRQAVS